MMKTQTLAATVLVVMTSTALAEDGSRPDIQKFRYNENYEYLSAPDAAQDALDTLKYVPLSSDVYLSIGGSVRERYENTQNPTFGDDEQDDEQDDDGVWLQRVNLHADLHLGPQLRIFTELSSGLSEGRAGGPSPVDENRLDFQNLFADITIVETEDATATFRVGRQGFSLGSGRLVDIREGTTVRRTFDGFRGMYAHRDWTVDVVAVSPRLDVQGVFDDETNDDQKLWAAYFSGPAGVLPNDHVDLYYFGFRNDDGRYVQGTEEEDRHTIGARFWGGNAGWDWNLEGAYQFGSFGEGDISAWTLASDTGYTFDETLFAPRLGLRANIASGDDDPNDSDLETFNPLYPRGNYFSQAAVLGPRNFFNFNPHLGLKLTDDLVLNTDVNFHWRLNENDGVYSPSGQIIRAPENSDARFVAAGLSLEATWSPFRYLDFTGIYTRLEPGDFIEETGSDESIDFFELTARFRF